MIRICCALAKLALRHDFIPHTFTGWEAAEAIPEIKHRPEALRRFVINGVLLPCSLGADVLYSFASDPILEFLGAFAWGQYCGRDADRWANLALALVEHWEECDGFRVALALNITAYARQLGWTPSPSFPDSEALVSARTYATTVSAVQV